MLERLGQRGVGPPTRLNRPGLCPVVAAWAEWTSKPLNHRVDCSRGAAQARPSCFSGPAPADRAKLATGGAAVSAHFGPSAARCKRVQIVFPLLHDHPGKNISLRQAARPRDRRVRSVPEHETQDRALVAEPVGGGRATTIDCASIILPMTPPRSWRRRQDRRQAQLLRRDLLQVSEQDVRRRVGAGERDAEPPEQCAEERVQHAGAGEGETQRRVDAGKPGEAFRSRASPRS